MSKILSSCVTDVLEYQAERLHLLPNHHFGGRAGRTTTDSLHLITKKIRDAWRSKKVASVLFLDVEAAFPSAILERLFHEMRRLGIPEVIVDWLRRKLQGRRTKLSFNDFMSDLFEIVSGIDQGCPLSVILYKIYNCMLLECIELLGLTGADMFAFIDDVAVIALRSNLQQTCEILIAFMQSPGGANNWSRMRNSLFALAKLALLHFDPKLRTSDLGPDLDLNAGTVTPSCTTKFLGVLLDHKLKFKDHADYALAKGMKWLQQFARLSRPKHSLKARHVRSLYQQMLLPAMLYASSVWITPQRKIEGRKRTYGSVGVICKLARVHRQACILMSGAMRTTATDILKAHMDVLPFHLLVDLHISCEASRMCSVPTSHPLHPHIRRATHFVKRHRSPLHEVLAAYNLHPDDVETIEAVRLPPGWHPPYPISIAPTKEEAATAEASWIAKPGYRLYTDGSDCDGGVGASAVLYRPGVPELTVLRYHLGDSTRHSVYEAELVGLLLATHLLLALISFQLASCAADNQACLLAVRNRRPHPAHYLVDRLLRSLDAMAKRHPGAKLTLRDPWSPQPGR